MDNDSHQDSLEFQQIAKSNLNKINSAISKMGYSDGITEGRETVFQKGFDIGYCDGFKSGFEFAKYKSCAKILNENKKQFGLNLTNDAERFSTGQTNHLQSKFLQENTNFNLEDASKAQTQFVDQKINQLKNEFQHLGNLLE